ncbi:MAG: hypothetical protein KDJ54_11195 [Candidatus Competibacteraceae bacterium]|nr:hypothetical protein [Candidatus Competibacteraceae bacterium]
MMVEQKMTDPAVVNWAGGGAGRDKPEKYSAKPAVGADGERLDGQLEIGYFTGSAFVEQPAELANHHSASGGQIAPVAWNSLEQQSFSGFLNPVTHRAVWTPDWALLFFPSHLEFKFLLAKINMHLYHK